MLPKSRYWALPINHASGEFKASRKTINEMILSHALPNLEKGEIRSIIKYSKFSNKLVPNATLKALPKKWSFPLSISLVYVNKPGESCGMFHIYETDP